MTRSSPRRFVFLHSSRRSWRSSGATGSKHSSAKQKGSSRSVEKTSDTTSVERDVTIAASPETVWEFLIDPDKATRWMGLTASFDPRPGGEYVCNVIPGHTARGEFVELDPPRRLV